MIWLPRLIDQGTGFSGRHHSDYALPTRPRSTSRNAALRLTPAWIESVVRDMTSDEAIGATLRQRIPLSDEEIQTRCAATFRRNIGGHFLVLDRDDRYVRGLGYPLPTIPATTALAVVSTLVRSEKANATSV